MKKLFGLALIGLMAGTAGAATKDSTKILPEEHVYFEPGYDYGAISVAEKYDTVKTITVTKSCSEYIEAKSCGIFQFNCTPVTESCKGTAAGDDGYQAQWTVTYDTTKVVNYGGSVATIYADSAAAADEGVDTTLYRQSVSIPEPITVSQVVYKRKNTHNGSKIEKLTMVFPFDIPSKCITSNTSLYKLNQIKYDDDAKKWIVLTTKDESSVIKANTPRIVLSFSGEVISFKSSTDDPDCSYTLQTGDFNVDSIQATGLSGKWYLGGTYERKTGLDTKMIYGFASKAKEVNGKQVALSQFVKAGANASVPPLRAFLQYSTSGFTAKAAAGVISSIGAEELPSTIDVIFEDEDGNTLSIAQLNTRTGEIVADKDAWFDMKGRKLNKKPTVKGTYYNNGQKVIIK